MYCPKGRGCWEVGTLVVIVGREQKSEANDERAALWRCWAGERVRMNLAGAQGSLGEGAIPKRYLSYLLAVRPTCDTE